MIVMLFVICALLPFALPMIMWSWRSLFSLTALLGLALAYHLWRLDHYMRTAHDPDWVGFDQAFSTAMAFFLGLGVVTCAVTLVMRSRDFSVGSRTVVALLVFAAPFALAGIIYGPAAWQRWTSDSACLKARHELKIGLARYRVQLAAPFVIYGQLPTRAGIHTYWRRERLCKATRNGAKAIAARSLTFKFDRDNGLYKQCIEGRSLQDWVKPLCDQLYQKERRAQFSTVHVPTEAHLFVADQVRSEKFGAMPSTFAAAKSPVEPDRKLFFVEHPTERSPDGSPLTAACRPRGYKMYACQVAYSKSDGITVMFEFLSKRAAIANRVTSVNRWFADYIRQFEK